MTQRLTFTLTDPDFVEREVSLTVVVTEDHIRGQVEAFRKFLLAQEFDPVTINRAIGERDE